MKRVVLFLLFAAAACAQPFVFYRGAVNAASFLPPGLPNGAIARGSMFSIFGRNLGPTAAQQVVAFPLQPTFAAVSVELTQGATKVNALPVFVSSGQLNVILPSNAPLGAVSLRVLYNGQASNPIPITVTATSMGLFSVNGGGFGPGIVQNFISDNSQPINSLTATARQGQVEILWGTGLGPAPFPDSGAPVGITLDTPIELYIGGKRAKVIYSGRTPCCASIDQIVFEVPPDAPNGCYVPVVARTRGAVVSNTVTMAIHPSGGVCSDAHNPLNQARAGGKVAIAQLARESLRVDVKVRQPYDMTLDHLLAAFRSSPASDFYFNALTAPPPLGSCTVYSGGARNFFAYSSVFAPPGSHVNPGSPLRVEAGAATATVRSSAGFDGTFYALLGGQSPLGTPAPPALLNAGPFTLSSPGSAVAAAFRAVLDGVLPPTWTNRDQTTTVDRTQDLPLTWSAPPGGQRGTLITGFSERTSRNAISGFVCMAASGATTFTIPSYVLAALPASETGVSTGTAQISVVNVPVTSSFSIPGFDASYLGVSNWSSKTVVIK